jgi:hypothetical protein
MYTVELLDGNCFFFPTEHEAILWANMMAKEWKCCVQIYPTEPEEVQDSPFGGMCEPCERFPAASGDFICEECLSLMALDMEKEDY